MKTPVQTVRDPAPWPIAPKLVPVEWVRLRKNVHRLEMRIMRAEQNGERRKAKSLRRLLAMSFSAKVLAATQPMAIRGENETHRLGLTSPSPALL